jgi:CHASE1-domain containing sensor protein
MNYMENPQDGIWRLRRSNNRLKGWLTVFILITLALLVVGVMALVTVAELSKCMAAFPAPLECDFTVNKVL